VLTEGSISLFSAPRPTGHLHRYLSVSPGMMFGETAMLDGGGRTASAVADTASVVHALMGKDLDMIEREDPRLASNLHHNIAVHLAQRLRSAAAAWHSSTR
jgi:glutaminase